ncbi:shikimate dehydrogenase [Endomicrobiia bacterium]|nr:shikimate dehydrogenase [Endomicrobiia bacterium]
MLNTETKLFAILGCPVKHSLSPQMQNKWFERERLNCAYLAFEPDMLNLKKTIESLKILKFSGFNVTVPHKVTVMKYVDAIDKSAKKIGSINTVAVKNSKLCGYNTDYLGFICDLDSKKVNLKNKNVLIIGSGGAARAIAYALKTVKAKNIYVANRTLAKAEYLAKTFKIKSVDMSKVADILLKIDLLVNSSSCGMKKDDILPFNASKVKNSLIIYDLIYNKITPFVKFAKSNGLKIFTGEGMLIHQGACAFKIWTGKHPDTKVAEQLFKKFII